MDLSRRQLLRGAALAGAFLGLAGRQSLAQADPGNFRYVYGNEPLRAEFRDFLVNVFHLYPEDELHALIEELANDHLIDEDIYRALQNRIGAITPFLSALTYSLPALRQQKREMAKQTVSLLAGADKLDGYLEIGSHGRYVDALEERLSIRGERFFCGPLAPTYSFTDIVDRGQLPKAGPFIPLNDYATDLNGVIPSGSIDLVTVYIGFHHCPVDLRASFLGQIRQTMSDRGVLIVRDHDAHNETMWRKVALAHDVFNMGTAETWEFNDNERRLFYPLTTLHQMLTEAGFKTDGRRLLQQGDPTLNTLMLYTKA
ncbi:MAG: dehydrogenase [Gammaproteobacteria bacterium]